MFIISAYETIKHTNIFKSFCFIILIELNKIAMFLIKSLSIKRILNNGYYPLFNIVGQTELF